MYKNKYKYTLLTISKSKTIEAENVTNNPFRIIIPFILFILCGIYYINKIFQTDSLSFDNATYSEIQANFSEIDLSTILSIKHFETIEIIESYFETTKSDEYFNVTSKNIITLSNKSTSRLLVQTNESSISKEAPTTEQFETTVIPTTDVNSTESDISVSKKTSKNVESISRKPIKFFTNSFETTPTSAIIVQESFLNSIKHLTTGEKSEKGDIENVTKAPLKVKSKISKSIKPNKFYVKTEHCRMPWVNPFTPAIKKMFKPEKYKDCSNDKSLVRSFFDKKLQHYILQTNLADKDVSCCYKQIVRTGSGKKADKQFKLLPCTVFHQNFTVPLHIDAIIVDCKSKLKEKMVQQDAFFFIQKRNSSAINCTQIVSRKKPSVLLFGIDSLSRFNFRRNMPKTAKFLEERKWIELEGYNKVGDNTFPNLMPLLTGLNESKSYSKCNPKSANGLDKCEFIWKNFKSQGYETAYAEDTADLSTFNYLKAGFLKPPTDYYLRPMVMAIEKHLKVVNKARLKYCVGRKHSAEYIYDFGLEFGMQFDKEPKFGMFWTNSFSHNSYSTASSMDLKIREYFEKMENYSILEEAIVLFFSDHGCRWGPLLNLPEGFLEERLPMFFISLPKWFQSQHPDFIKALKINKNRLTTPFDIHQTLKHILAIGVQDENKIQPSISCPTAHSIFYEINKSRTCKSACIPDHYCTCDPYEVLSKKNPEVKKVTDLIIKEINSFLKAKNFSSLCHILKLDTVDEAQVKIEQKQNATHNETFRIKFRTSPKRAKFQTTATYDIEKHEIHVIIDDISRLDSYAPYSKCIDDKIAKKFCICNH